MAQDSATKSPAPAPGDAEAPPKEQDRTAAEAVKHSDRTEPTPSAQDRSNKPN